MSAEPELVSVLRDGPTRRVCLVRVGDQLRVVRTLTAARVPRHFGRLVHHAVLTGQGSFVALGDEVAMTLEGHAAAARLLPQPGDPPRWSCALDAGVDHDGHVTITTTWIEGTPLHRLPRAPAPDALDDDARVAATRAILEVVAALHAVGVAHGDLKSSNLVLRPDGGVGLIDLDTLRQVPSPDVGAPTRDRTEAWAAPEQLDRHETWLGSDLWALARVLRELWGDALPEPWRLPLAQCRVADPGARPTVDSLTAALFAGAACVDHRGQPCAEPPPEGEAPRPPAGATERVAGGVAGATERVGPQATERVTDAAPDPLPPPREARVPAPPVPAPRRSATGCLGLVELAGKGAVAASFGGALLLCGGLFGLQQFARYHADQEAERLMADIKIHKTDPDRNGSSVRDGLARRAAALMEDQKTARTCATNALTLVWAQKWHFDDAFSPTDFDTASRAVNDPMCRAEVETSLARATLYAGACRRRDTAGPSVSDCELALDAAEDFFARVPTTPEWTWLRVEGAWQEVRARSALQARYLDTGNAEAGSQGDAAIARCREAEAWVGFAPVNGPELLEECVVVAGQRYDVGPYLYFADLRLKSLPVDEKPRRKVLTWLYRAAGPECDEVKVTWKKGNLRAAGPSWCVASGHAARGCTLDAGMVMAEGSFGDSTHPWERLGAALLDRGGTCLQ